MSDIIDFSKGLNSDNSEINQPKGTYRYMFNGVNISEEGDIFNLSNEKGTINKVTTFPIGFKIIGGTVLNTDLICFLVDPINNYSQVGIIDSNFIYTRKAPSNDTGNQLGLDITHQISCVARRLFTGQRIVYYVDNNSAFSSVNLDNPPIDSNLAEISRLIPNQKLAKIDLKSIKENVSGNLIAGVYQIITRYRTVSLNPTSYGIPCNPIPMVENLRSEGRNNYDGEYPNYNITNKALEFEISNLDIAYPYLEVTIIYYTGFTNTFTAQVLPLFNITSDKLTFLFNGANQDATPILQSDIQQLPISYNTAKCLVQKDDRLFASNLRETNSLFDTELQNIANNITVKYQIEEIQYLDGLSGTSSITFTINQSPYLLGTINDLYIEFTDQVDPTTGQDITKYTLKNVTGGGGTSNPISATIDGTNNKLVHLVFAIAIDNTFTLEINSSINNYSLGQTYNSGGLFLSIIYGAPPEISGNSNALAAFNDYKNEYICFSKRGYQRDEVYSLGFSVIFKDGSTAFVYHIPGYNTLGLSSAIPDVNSYIGNTQGQLGIYSSIINYPINQNYPTGVIRHHIMPSLQQEPHFRYDVGTTNTFIRILGLQFTINTLLSDKLRSAIQGIMFFRQRRNVSTNQSILSQGLVTKMVPTYNDYQANDPGNPQGDLVYKKMPFFNKSTISQTQVTWGGSTINSVAISVGAGDYSRMAFFSPESLFGKIGASTVQGANLKTVLKLNGNVSVPNVYKSENYYNNVTVYTENRLSKSSVLSIYNNFFQENTSFTSIPTPISFALDIKRGNTTLDGTIKIDSTTSTDYLYLRIASPLSDTQFGTASSIDWSFKASSYFASGSSRGGLVNDDSYIASPTDQSNSLFNIVKTNINQYGQISSAEYIPIAEYFTIPTTNPTPYTLVYGGDTFISKFAYVNKEVFNYKGLYRNLVKAVHSHSYINPSTAIGQGAPDLLGCDMRGLGYYFVESMFNCNYRHQYNKYGNTIPIIPAGTKYFPNSSGLDVLAEDPRNGDSTSYNTQYSFENDIKLFYSKNISYTPTSSGAFETRTVYSEQIHQDELSDNFRVFLQNSYYDIPKHTGPIWNSFVYNNTLYLHTPKSLWRTFVNEVGTQVSTQGDVVLGAGGVFALPSKEIYTSGGGYAGTISQFGGAHTPFGYIFPDALQGKLFMLGSNLEEISQEGLMQYFNKNLLIGLENYTDNPSNPSSVGILGIYDFALKRYIISKRGTSKDFTLSYSLLNKTWLSYHGYFPNLFTSINNRLFGFDNTNTIIMHEHNIGARGVYYNNPVQPWIIEYIDNNNSPQTKAFDNIYLRTHSEDSSGNYLHLETFKYIRGTNEKQDTGIVTLSCTNLFNDSSNVKKKQDQFQIAVPRNSLGVNPLFPDRMKGKYMEVRLTYPNTNNYKLLLNYIVEIDRPVAR
jgi:hypothetical protein